MTTSTSSDIYSLDNEEVDTMKYRFKYERGHVVVYKNGRFWGTYDTIGEAKRDILEEESEEGEL